jgi:hypothetical protein
MPLENPIDYVSLSEQVETIVAVSDFVRVIEELASLSVQQGEFVTTTRELLLNVADIVKEWEGGNFDLDPIGERFPDAQRLRLIGRLLWCALPRDV